MKRVEKGFGTATQGSESEQGGEKRAGHSVVSEG